MVEKRHLILIEAVHRLGSLSKAAEELHLTPSALSHQLKQLEQTLGIPLFHRLPNRMTLTDFGQTYLASARTILDQFDQLDEVVTTAKRNFARDYIHGYSGAEQQRLYDQANSIADFIHWDSEWPDGTTVLEAGCGVGAQTVIIAQRNPGCRFVSVDLSEPSLETATNLIQSEGLNNVTFRRADLQQLPYPAGAFDHVFCCFVLEHVAHPTQILQELKRVTKPGGSITCVEGDHGSTYFHPDSEAARRVVQLQVDLQADKGGNANIGRQLFPLLQQAGFSNVQVSPRQIYVDDSRPALVEGFTLNTFTAMIKGVGPEGIERKRIGAADFQRGIRDLERTAAGGGTFCYTFFKAVGTV